MTIKQIKKRGNLYRIYLDDETIDVYAEVIIEYRLLNCNQIDDEMFNKIILKNNFYKNYYKAILLIKKRLRSELEIREYLNKQECDYCEEIIEKLKNIKLIDDYRFAKAYVNDKVNLSSMGSFKIKTNLEKLGINNYIIEDVISEINEDVFIERINKIIDKKIKSSNYTGLVLKNKLYSYLINLGYSKDLISQILEKKLLNVDLKDKMEREYFKLSCKYDNNELKFKLKQKLFKLGLPADEINNFIEEKGI